LLLERARWLDVLLEMTRVFPSSVWIRSLSLPTKESASIVAQASSIEAVSNLMVKLKKSPYFEEPNLGNVSTPKEGKVVSFPMKWEIKRVVKKVEEKPPPQAAEKKAGGQVKK
ncbi:PilN domain-containing protein, partial [bacterium]|nr:PilN domain-containing protein [bacterium]